jgi:hypothetical protein
LAARLGVEMPITAAVDAVLHRGMAIDAMIEALLSRPYRASERMRPAMLRAHARPRPNPSARGFSADGQSQYHAGAGTPSAQAHGSDKT